MKNLKFLLSLFIFISLVSSCSEEEIDPNPNSGTDPVQAVFPTTDVNVILPAGTSIDLSKTKILSGFAEFPVDNTGKSKIRFAPGTKKLAFLVDETENSLMMGFITDSKKEISIETTASILVYFGLGISLQPNEIKKKFIEDYQTMEGMAEFTQSISEEFSKNPEMIRNGAFMPSLTEYLSTFAPATSVPSKS